jgi:cytochrome P450
MKSDAPFAYDPLDPDVVADPYPYYAELRRNAPVYRVPSHGFWVVSRYADLIGVLRRPDLFTSAAMAAAVTRPTQFTTEREQDWEPEEAISIVGTDGERHTRMRNVVNRGFTPGRIGALAPRVGEIARELAAPLIEAGECEFLRDFAVPLPVIVIAEMLGVDPERRADFKRWSDAGMSAVFEPIEGEQQAREVGAAIEEMSDYFDGVIEERRRRPGPDLISTLIRAEEEQGRLTPMEVKTFVFTLLVAGSVTTTYLLANAWVALLAHPDQLAAVSADPALVPGLVEETLRYEPPVFQMLRTAARDAEVAGVTIPAGATVAALFAAANRDETVFPEPDRFDLNRHPKDHLSFGHGVHFCLGAALARLEARISFETWLPRVREVALLEPPAWIRSLVFRGPQRLRLAFRRP